MKKITMPLAAAVGITTVLAGCSVGEASSSEDAGGQLTFVGWGGAFQDAHRAAFLEPYGGLTGTEVREDAPTDYAKLKAQAESGNVMWDVINVEPHIAEQGCAEGWLEPLDYDSMEGKHGFHLDDIRSEFVGECGAPDVFYAYQIAYNTNTYSEGNHPTTWEEFFDVEKFPGKRGIYRNVSGGALEAALLADGVPEEDLYPLDVDRAFKKLDSIKEHLVLFGSGDEQLQLLASGETPLTIGWNGRIQAGQAENQPVAGEWNQHFQRYTQLVVPAGSPNIDVAHDFLAFALSPEPQAEITKHIAYAPVNEKAVPNVDPQMEPYLPSNDEAQELGIPLNFEFYSEDYAGLTERFNEWLAQ